MQKKYKGMIITDLDGTLLDNNSKISQENLDTLKKLGDEDYCRVVATGRSVYSFSEVIPNNFPIDYLVFSTGAGILNWITKEIEYYNNLPAKHVLKISNALKKRRLNFIVHKAVPNNHEFEYFINSQVLEDFDRRCQLYKNFSTKKQYEEEYIGDASQFLIIFDKIDEQFKSITNELNDFKVIRTTSPIGGDLVWMEIFPKGVSKGNTVEWLCNHLNISLYKTLGIGNDYNDLDLLDFTHNSFVVDNAPEQLKAIYKVAPSNINNGFSSVALDYINQN